MSPLEIHITDVTLRDGIQAESITLPTSSKLELLGKIDRCGYDRVEITSFVSPKWIPQLADSQAFCEQVFAKRDWKTQEWMAFVPNLRGFENFLKFPIPWASAFVATSETFNKKNVNQEIEATLSGLASLRKAASQQGRKLRIYISTVFGCPYEKQIAPAQWQKILKRVADLAPDEIALSDTIGVATPSQIVEVLGYFSSHYPVAQTALHLHNTYGNAMACLEEGYRMGVRRFDGSTGGVGGCPYAKGATGNVATEEILYLWYRQRRIAKFPWVGLTEIYDLMKRLGLSTHSHLSEIYNKGGDIYGL